MTVIDEARAVMLADLGQMHATIFAAYELALKISGIDLAAEMAKGLGLSTKHLPVD